MKKNNKNNNSLLSNLSWKFAERITAQLVTFVVSIILARLLEPSHYGTIALVTIFITLANVFVSDGFGSALIQKKNADDLDFSSVFYFNIFFSVVLYIVLFFCAPLISQFYGEGYEILTPVLRVLGIRVIITGVNSVQQAYVSRNMMFRKFFWATLFGTIVSAVVGVVMALLGFGVWALVFQYLTNTTVDTIVLNIAIKFRPKLMFSFSRLKTLLKFGIKILGTSLLITGYQELRALLIGKIYTSSDLAYFDKAKQFPQLIVVNINSSISAVLFPKMSKEQDDPVAIKRTTRNSIRFSSFFMCPLMMGLAAVADPFVRLLLTDKWIEIVPLLQVFCIVFLFQPIHTANMQAIKAIGRSDIYMKLEIIKKVIELIVLIISLPFGVSAIVIGMAICTTCFTVFNAFPNVKLLNYSFKEQAMDILPNILCSLLMAVFVYLFGFFNTIWNMPNILLVFIQVLIGGFIYTILAIITKSKELNYILTLFKGKFVKTNHEHK